MHVSPAKHSSVSVTDGRTDRQTDGQTDGQTTDKVIPTFLYVSLCFAGDTKICLFPVTYLKIIESVGWDFFFFFLRIVMHNNAAKSKNRCYTSNFDIYLPCRISSDMSWICQFDLKLIHMNRKYIFLFSSLIVSINQFGSEGFKQGWANRWSGNTGNKHIFFGLNYNIHVHVPNQILCINILWKDRQPNRQKYLVILHVVTDITK